MVRFKNRYFLFELIWQDGTAPSDFDAAALWQTLRDSLAENFGDASLGAALQSLQVKIYDPKVNLAIVRCSRDEHQHLWCAATLLTTAGALRRRVALRMVRLSGVLRPAQEAALRAGLSSIGKLKVSEDRKEAMRQDWQQRVLALQV
ncbi:unnamed protein product [Pedinophyceae sp. YPF-701]|nr:unnamed protein product [Pedinophyceae sp. YPF-701]